MLMDRAEMESSRVLIVNYLTDGPGTGLCGEGEERFLYQKRADGRSWSPAGSTSACMRWCRATGVWDWLVSRRQQLQDWAAAHGLAAGRACLRGILRPGP